MKHVRIPRHLWSLGMAGALALGMALGPESGLRAGAQPAPPPPPLPAASLTPLPTDSPTPLPSGVPVPTAAPSAAEPVASPSPAPTPAPRRRGRHGGNAASPAPGTPSPEPTATPTSPAFATLDGTWELQLQYIDRTEYSYLTLQQTTGGTLSGTWHLSGKNAPSYPLTGTYDGRLIRISATEPGGPVAFNGYVEGASDMIGLATFGANAATAEVTPAPNAPVAPLAANDGVAFTAEHRGVANRKAVKR